VRLTEDILPTAPLGTSRRRRRTRRAFAVAAILALAAAATPSAALAAGTRKPHSGTTGSSAPLTLTGQSTGRNPYRPDWCMTEDGYDQRTFSGSLSGSYSATETLCGLESDYYNGYWYDAGGLGIESDVYVTGALSDLAITSPDGAAHHAVLMGQTTDKGTTTYHYAVCYVPTYSGTYDTAMYPLVGGTWQITLRGQISSARWAVNTQMTSVAFQQSHCPTSEQNIV